MTTSTPAVCRFMDDALLRGDAMASVELIAQVLRGARLMAEALDAPNDSRAILRVAHSFADELATTDPDFDRLRFIRTATGAR